MRSRTRRVCGKDMREGNWAEIANVSGIGCVGVVKPARAGMAEAMRRWRLTGPGVSRIRGEGRSRAKSSPSFCTLERSVGYPAVMARPWRHGHDAEHFIE